jgi:hypothetical protein
MKKFIEIVRDSDSWTESRRSWAGGTIGEKKMMNLDLEKDKSVFKLVIRVAQWDVLMKEFVAEVVSNGVWWCLITVGTGAGCGEGMVVGARRSGRRTLTDDGYSISALQHMLAPAS